MKYRKVKQVDLLQSNPRKDNGSRQRRSFKKQRVSKEFEHHRESKTSPVRVEAQEQGQRIFVFGGIQSIESFSNEIQNVEHHAGLREIQSGGV